MPVTINGQVVNIGIDTGAEQTVITPEAAAQLDLPQDPHRRTKETGGGGTYMTNNVIINSLIFGNTEYKSTSAPVVTIDYHHDAEIIKRYGAGRPMIGLIGTDILSNYDIEYDVPNYTFTLYHVAGCKGIIPPWKGQMARMKSPFRKRKAIVFQVMLDGHQVGATLDTGASAMYLTSASARNIGLTPDVLAKDQTAKITGAGGLARRYSQHYFNAIIIGREVMKGGIFVIDFPNTQYDMLIGEDYMQRRRF